MKSLSVRTVSNVLFKAFDRRSVALSFFLKSFQVSLRCCLQFPACHALRAAIFQRKQYFFNGLFLNGEDQNVY